MIIGIIAAMAEELSLIVKAMNTTREENKAKMNFKYGELYGNEVVAVVCGIGKVNAAICAQILIDDFKVDKVINVGVAGGTGKDVMPGDVVIGNSLVQHDVDTSAFGDKIGQIPRLDTYSFKCDEELINAATEACEAAGSHNYFIGRIVTGDQFINDALKVKWLNSEFDALACEMEGGSIAQTCYLNCVPFVIIRSISDNANNGAHMDYDKFVPIAVENSTNILKSMLKNKQLNC
ncbi:MAG: S-adenosylhomocysteine nucleosidase [Clostridiaceae bacterium]|jgi:adenosylhomocysteine nucleosidase|nr:S-adenosylhomocysteine nucleosidase [Clostridiaceae bacterium]